MRLILITGSFGTGTTAVTAALVAMGIPSIPPYYQVDDPRTPNTYESLAFKKLVYLLTNESTFQVDVSKAADFKQGLKELIDNAAAGEDDTIVLKSPLASLCLHQIVDTVDTKVIMLHRPLDAIEATRERRKWHAVYGKAGAQVIYSRLLTDLIDLNKSFLAISYPAVLKNPEIELRNIIDFCRLEHAGKQLQKGVDTIRT